MTSSALPRQARLLLVGVAVDALGNGLALPFLVVYLHDVRHLALETVGLIAATPPVVAVALLGPLGPVIDRYGARRTQLGALTGQIAGIGALAFATDAPKAFVAAVLMGVGHAAFWPANQALVAGVVPEDRRQRYFGISFSLLNAGIGVGGIAGALWADIAVPRTFEVLYLADAATCLIPLALLLGPLRGVGGPIPVAHDEAPGTYRDVLADPAMRRLLVLTALTAFVGYGMFEAGWTGFARTVAHASTRVIGLAFAANTATIVVLQLAVLRRIEGRRRTRLLMVMAGIWAVAWSLLAVGGRVSGTLSAVLLVASLSVFALGETLLSPVAPALTQALAPEALRGRYNAAGSLMFQLGAIAAPVTAGFLLGARLPLVFIAVVLAGCAALVLAAFALEPRLTPRANGLREPADLDDDPRDLAAAPENASG